MKHRFLLLFFLLSSCSATFAQTFSVAGVVKDAADSSVIAGATVLIADIKDSTHTTGTTTDSAGHFELTSMSEGRYMLKVIYLGYKVRRKFVSISGGNVDVGTLFLRNEATTLKGVTVSGVQVRADQLGDTTQFHADVFKTHPDASAEDLVTKMPGVTSDNSGVKVNGEAVQQVYVDGKPFFGNDPTLALRNLPAEVIDKIQIFDKLSDQSTFTGFDDGNSQKTMNITTKSNKSEGTFGKVYAGGGTDDRYIAGGNLNIFDGDQRISILGLANDINQQNFSAQDILGVTGSNSGQNRGGMGGGRGNFGGGGGGGSSSNFLVGQQNGIATTNSFGINYSDNWGSKVKVMGSYFFNETNTTNTTNINRNYFTNNDTSNIYAETDNTNAVNYNNRVNFRLEYTMDSFNSLIFTPNISFQNNNTSSSTIATDMLGNFLSSQTVNRSTAINNGYSSSSNLLLQHKFAKPRRTISVVIAPTLNEKSGTGTYYAQNNYYSSNESSLLDQHNTLYTNGYTLSSNITYTEPVGTKGQIMASYNPSLSKNIANKETYNVDNNTQQYSNFDTFLSNKYQSSYHTQKGGLSYRIGDKKLNFMVGCNYQYATLDGSQTFPYSMSLQPRNFSDLLPIAMFNYRFSDGRNLRIMYRTNTVAPSVTQLQDVVDVSNPLLLKTGNPDLTQDYEQTMIVRYGQTKSKSGHNFFVYLYGNYINHYIGNATLQPGRDSLFQGPLMTQSILINKGSQLTLPVNLNGCWNEKAFVTYGIPLEFIKCNLNLNGGMNYSRTPGLVNNQLNYSENTVPTGGVVFSSNIGEKLDFTLSYTGSYNFVKNSVQTTANNNYYSHIAVARINWILHGRLVINTNFSNNYYTAFSSTGNQNYNLWTTYIGYKMLKNKALEARLTFYDMLNQNTSISRTVTETYVENDINLVLKQYALFQLTYTIRNFKGALPQLDKPDHDHDNPMFQNWRNGQRPGGGGF